MIRWTCSVAVGVLLYPTRVIKRRDFLTVSEESTRHESSMFKCLLMRLGLSTGEDPSSFQCVMNSLRPEPGLTLGYLLSVSWQTNERRGRRRLDPGT